MAPPLAPRSAVVVVRPGRRIWQLARTLRRRTGLRRLPGAKTWVGLGVFAYNLQRMTVVAAG